MSVDVNLMVGNISRDRYGTMKIVSERVRHGASGRDYAWNSSTCACDCDRDFQIEVYLKDYECMNSLVHELVVSCDEIVDIPETTPILANKTISNVKIN